MRFTNLAYALATVAIVGCTTNPYTGEKQVSKTAWGAGIGAVAGAAVGAATGGDSKERRDRALKGAAIGGVGGAGIGAYMDYQEKKLREQLKGVGVGVSKDPNTGAITLIMPGNITFKTADSNIKADFYTVLDGVAKVLAEYNKTAIAVGGFSDNVGRDDYNIKLSQDRANSVAAYLMTRNIDGGRLRAEGFGKSQPIADNSTENGRAQNRRVEIKILPPESL